ncbi:WD repeat protein Lub1 [Blastocladiella emersonii ATCC 22665]|nr:WD repeat protein Lub1 [Blastocladiella emersonii ATCC 22665]
MGHTVSTSADAANEFVDPFTGGNRYTPAGSSAPSAFAAPPATGAAGASNASAFSPWTSGYTTSTLSSASSAAAPATYSPTSASAGRLAAVPVKEFVTFKQINYGAIANKLAKQQSDFGVTLSPAAGTAAELEEHPWSTATSSVPVMANYSPAFKNLKRVLGLDPIA